jgi:pSer/pThr/pTyr-binding forkhead associated (FHA) protein
MAGPSFQLIMHTGPNQGKVAPLEKNELYIGRDLSNDIVINDAEISRRHARLMLQAGGYVLEDLGSTNGTSVNGQRLLGPYILRSGDVITLGEHVNIGFEPVSFDPDATLAAVPARPVTGPVGAQPVNAPPVGPQLPPSPYPAYAGQVPGSMAAAEELPVSPKRNKGLVIGIVAGVLVAVSCVCGGILWIIDANYLWCTIFPFLPGCP